jgi:hypothetical protein
VDRVVPASGSPDRDTLAANSTAARTTAAKAMVEITALRSINIITSKGFDLYKKFVFVKQHSIYIIKKKITQFTWQRS